MSAPPVRQRLGEWTPDVNDAVFAGHFPGNPLLPGAILIDWAITALAQKMGWSMDHGSIRQAKFLSPARPSEPLSLDYIPAPRGRGKLQVTARRHDDERTLVLELLVETGTKADSAEAP
ncbi:hypothetical protein P8631_07110 [Guyparkeria sp. 1SP6A2]|nr:hypothetical protein [Guyparkeria sp. 1SP6A2]